MEAVSEGDSAIESDVDAAEAAAGTDDSGSESDMEGFGAVIEPDIVAPLL